MADYYPLIIRGVSGLEKNTGEARRALYERARTALVGQLRNMNPPLTESEITRERLALEEAIRKVEAESARRIRTDPQPEPPPRPTDFPPRAGTAAAAAAPAAAPATAASPEPTGKDRILTEQVMLALSDAPIVAPPPPPPSPPPASQTPTPSAAAASNAGAVQARRERTAAAAAAAAQLKQSEPPPRRRAGAEPPPAAPFKSLRDVVIESDGLGEKAAQATKSARVAYAAVQPDPADRIEPRLDAESLRLPVRDPSPFREPQAPPSRDYANRDYQPQREAPRDYQSRDYQTQRDPAPPPRDYMREQQARDYQPRDLPPQRNEPPPRTQERPMPPPRAPNGRNPGRGPGRRGKPDIQSVRPPRSRKGVVAAIMTLVVIFGLAVAAYVMRDRIPGWLGAVRQFTPSAQRDTTPPKISDRIGQDGQLAQVPLRPGQTGPQAAVAQRVVLYEEDPAEPAGKRYVGSAIWRNDTISPGPGQPPELIVRCDVEIPERRIGMTMTIRRNTDTTLPASHTIEVQFNLPTDFPFGGINNVPGILMKQAEQTRGAPLSGLAVKVTAGFFLIGLSAVDTELQRNIQLLKERTWFDIPVVYNNGRRAILAIEKGTPGERAFADAFAAWKQ